MIRVRRTSISTGAVLEDSVRTLRDAEARVAWCGTDNLFMTRAAASAEAVKAGRAFKAGQPFVLNAQYRFELVDKAVRRERPAAGVPPGPGHRDLPGARHRPRARAHRMVTAAVKRIAGAAAAALALTAGTALATASPAEAASSCILTGGSFGHQEFLNWYNGARWGDGLDHVENVYAGCAGNWESGQGDWNGHTTQVRTWPRSDGGATEITFAHYTLAPNWRAHDTAETHSGSFASFTRVCEWPRDNNGPCTPV